MISMYSGWWYTYPSEKYEFVSWDDDIPNMMGKKIMFKTTNLIGLEYPKNIRRSFQFKVAILRG